MEQEHDEFAKEMRTNTLEQKSHLAVLSTEIGHLQTAKDDWHKTIHGNGSVGFKTQVADLQRSVDELKALIPITGDIRERQARLERYMQDTSTKVQAHLDIHEEEQKNKRQKGWQVGLAVITHGVMPMVVAWLTVFFALKQGLGK